MSTAATPRSAVGSRRVEHCMGTVFSIDIRDPGEWTSAIDSVVAWLHHVDAVFSTYRPDSDVCRLRRGELTLDEADPLAAEVFAECARMQARTDGYFTSRWDGSIDPTGLVKGWAVERASARLRSLGSRNHAVNGGGDIQLRGEFAPGRPWQVGISDPSRPRSVLATVQGNDFAVATSGTAERGAHIRNPYTGRAAVGLLSVTVVGPSLVEADVFATAAFAMGEGAVDWLERQPGYEGLVVSAAGRARPTSGWPRPGREALLAERQ